MVKDDEASLTTTTVATGLNFPEFTLIDSDGARYSVVKATPFGRKSAWLDMGTSQFRVFLELRTNGKLDLASAKALVKDSDGSRAIDGAESIAQLIEACRH